MANNVGHFKGVSQVFSRLYQHFLHISKNCINKEETNENYHENQDKRKLFADYGQTASGPGRLFKP